MSQFTVGLKSRGRVDPSSYQVSGGLPRGKSTRQACHCAVLLICVLGAISCLMFLAFGLRCTTTLSEPVEVCYDDAGMDLARWFDRSGLIVNRVVLTSLFGSQMAACFVLLVCKRRNLDLPWRHLRRSLGTACRRINEAKLWTSSLAIIAYLTWTLGHERAWFTLGLVCVAVVVNTYTASCVAPIDLSGLSSRRLFSQMRAMAGSGDTDTIPSFGHRSTGGSSGNSNDGKPCFEDTIDQDNDGRMQADGHRHYRATATVVENTGNMAAAARSRHAQEYGDATNLCIHTDDDYDYDEEKAYSTRGRRDDEDEEEEDEDDDYRSNRIESYDYDDDDFSRHGHNEGNGNVSYVSYTSQNVYRGDVDGDDRDAFAAIPHKTCGHGRAQTNDDPRRTPERLRRYTEHPIEPEAQFEDVISECEEDTDSQGIAATYDQPTDHGAMRWPKRGPGSNDSPVLVSSSSSSSDSSVSSLLHPAQDKPRRGRFGARLRRAMRSIKSVIMGDESPLDHEARIVAWIMVLLFLQNASLFIYDVTAMMARASAPPWDTIDRIDIMAGALSVWYRYEMLLFFNYKHAFPWCNVMVPRFTNVV